MVKCGSSHCTAICDFCTEAIHEMLEDNSGEKFKGKQGKDRFTLLL